MWTEFFREFDPSSSHRASAPVFRPRKRASPCPLLHGFGLRIMPSVPRAEASRVEGLRTEARSRESASGFSRSTHFVVFGFCAALDAASSHEPNSNIFNVSTMFLISSSLPLHRRPSSFVLHAQRRQVMRAVLLGYGYEDVSCAEARQRTTKRLSPRKVPPTACTMTWCCPKCGAECHYGRRKCTTWSCRTLNPGPAPQF